MKHCIICNQSVSEWKAHPNITRRSEFTTLLEVVGSDLSIYECPACGCNDRERHLWLYMDSVGIINAINGMRVLHVAPEPHIEKLISSYNPKEYVCGDLLPQKSTHCKIDIQNLKYESDYFNLIICNHVLEHVSEPEIAVKEMKRCLTAGGFLIAQTPYSPLLKKTFELNIKPSEDFAKLFFGQEDHVRLFGKDINKIFINAGLTGEMLSHEIVLKGIDSSKAGINAKEPFFLYTK